MILGEETITLRRYDGAGAYADGKWIEGSTSDTAISASVQPAEGKDLEVLEAGLRSRQPIRIYTTTALVAVDDRDGTEGDLLVIDADIYRVHNVERQRSLIPHYKAIAVRLSEDT